MCSAEPIRVAPSRKGGHWTNHDYQALDFSTEEGWQQAVDIFEDRIRGRFLLPIKTLQNETRSYPGFAIMALDCLLIETLQQFYEGVDETPYKKSKSYFHDFLTKTSFSTFFDSSMADMFYHLIRCGILHKAEIKGSSRIWIRKDSPLVMYAPDRKGLHINRDKFHQQLIEEFEEYVNQLRVNTAANAELRRNFKRKMDFICK